MSDNDPRVFFAAERTLLAWLRTGLGLVAMGFVVTRFSLFVQIMRPELATHNPSWSLVVGVGLVALGTLTAAVATWQHRRFCRTLRANDLPPDYRSEFALMLGAGVTVAGAMMAVLLAT